MENNGISLELEEMRLQMATLQQQLNEHLKFDEGVASKEYYKENKQREFEEFTLQHYDLTIVRTNNSLHAYCRLLVGRSKMQPKPQAYLP